MSVIRGPPVTQSQSGSYFYLFVAFSEYMNFKDVGHLMVKVFKAKGLNSADIGGKSDPFAVVELCNDRCVTNTEYKTLTPTWQKVFQL